jgi:hypothetical protein
MEQHKQYIEQHKNKEECGPCPVFAGFTVAFALQLKEKHGKTSVRVVIHRVVSRSLCCDHVTALSEDRKGVSITTRLSCHSSADHFLSSNG